MSPLSPRWWFFWLALFAALAITLPSPRTLEAPEPALPSASAPASAADDLLADLLAMVPDTEAARYQLTYGDIGAWFVESGASLPASIPDLRDLPVAKREAFEGGLYRHLSVPGVLGPNYVFAEDLQRLVGFSLLTVDQYLAVGDPYGAGLAFLTVRNSSDTVASTLEATGYTATPLPGATLYSMGRDYRPDLTRRGPTAQSGIHNRIAILDSGTFTATTELLVAPATELITQTLAARAGEADSLADDPAYRSLVEVIGRFNARLGELVELTVMAGEHVADSRVVENYADLFAVFAENPLPPYSLAAFATHQNGDETFLTLVLVLEPGAYPENVASILLSRLAPTVIVQTNRPFDEQFEVVGGGVISAEQDVALVTVRSLEDAEFTWPRILWSRSSLSFLARGDEP